MKCLITLTLGAFCLSGACLAEERVIGANPQFCEVFAALSADLPAECADEAAGQGATRGLVLKNAPGPAKGATGAAGNADRPEKIGLPAPTERRAASFGSVRFAYDSDALTAEAENTLAVVAKVLAHPDMAGQKFLVEGHTDAAGSLAYNRNLSALRAVSVKRYLGRNGVRLADLETFGAGETRLSDPQNPLSAVNRRVVIMRLTP